MEAIAVKSCDLVEGISREKQFVGKSGLVNCRQMTLRLTPVQPFFWKPQLAFSSAVFLDCLEPDPRNEKSRQCITCRPKPLEKASPASQCCGSKWTAHSHHRNRKTLMLTCSCFDGISRVCCGIWQPGWYLHSRKVNPATKGLLDLKSEKLVIRDTQ